ncbi:hypothetical protein SKA34_14560 [Photobacterium sp. SKA34]|nr:hypothetical protein SKA34_14560 [Photobacterium sp. SKA34]
MSLIRNILIVSTALSHKGGKLKIEAVDKGNTEFVSAILIDNIEVK